jgi:hypothetical protein
MPLGKLIDYSQARPDLAAVKAAGYSAVYRYVCSAGAEAGLPGKRLTPMERDDILAAGLDIGLHGEDEANAASKGYNRGLEQGKQWGDYAAGILDAPRGMTIVAAVDYDTPGQYPAVVDDYLRGVNAGLAGRYELGVYGDYGVITGAHQAGRGLSCYVMTNAWDIDTPPDFCHLHQHGGTEFPNTDYNDVLRIPHGTWLQTLGGDMPLSDDDLYKIRQQVIIALADPTHSYLQDEFAKSNTAVIAGVKALLPPPVDQAALERAVVDAIAAALSAGIPVDTVEQAVNAALGAATIPVVLTGHAGNPPVTP